MLRKHFALLTAAVRSAPRLDSTRIGIMPADATVACVPPVVKGGTCRNVCGVAGGNEWLKIGGGLRGYAISACLEDV